MPKAEKDKTYFRYEKQFQGRCQQMRSLNKEEQKHYTEAVMKVYKQTGLKTHQIIKRHKIETIYVETNETITIGETIKPLYYTKKSQSEYEQFLCNKKHKTVILENWDFDFCPFCGDAMNL
ncbi:MAG: hypothetical protein J5747_00650 [Spirochaetaceae bacterium]|nr:hypothetical protein [Spirochaetaceae bacterium]